MFNNMVKSVVVAVGLALGMAITASAAVREASPIAIEVNIPAYRLDVYNGVEKIADYQVAVGRPRYETAQRDFYIDRIEWNPWWYPPNAPWARGERARPPGPNNPLGPVKMILGAGFLVHGTNKPESIGTAASHGCIRMRPDDARELAYKIMVLAGVKGEHKTPSEYAADPKTTYVVRLSKPVMARLSYRRVEIIDNALLIHPDPYREERLTPAIVSQFLEANGWLPNSVSEEQLAEMLKSAAKMTVSAPLATNLRVAGDPR